MDDFKDFCLFFMAILAGAFVLAAVIIASAILINKPFAEASCNQTAAQYHVQGDYKLMTDTCWLTAKNGQVVNANNFRQFEEMQGIGK